MNKIKVILQKIPIIYSSLVYLKYLYYRYLNETKFHRFYLNSDAGIAIVANKNNKQNFFGYYNISPFNTQGDILYCEAATQHVRGSTHEPLFIFLKQKDKIQTLGQSNAWNWQQGCLLQWYAESTDQIIYNDFYDGHYISVIKNIKTEKEKIVNYPIYSVARSGKFALTLNFERLSLMRPDYGYFNTNIIFNDLPNDENDGIWYVDILKNSGTLILSLETLKNFKPTKNMENAKHKVNHIDIAPDGERFMFLHRWVGKQGRYMRLLTADAIDGRNLHYVTGDSMVSHNCWLGDSNIISFCRHNKIDRYVKFKEKKGFIEIVGEDDFNSDGHPSVSPDGEWMLTDDYPGTARFSKLYMYHLKRKTKFEIGAFYQPLKYRGENRIDLHPKWSPDGKFVSIDSGHSGERKIYNINVEYLITKWKK